MDDDESGPPAVLFTLLMSVALASAAYLSPQRWAAAGLACMTISAVVATPELVEHLLRSAGDARRRSPMQWISRLLPILTKAAYAALAVSTVVVLALAAIGAVSPSGAAAAVLILGAVLAGADFIRRSLGEVVDAVATGGDVDRRLRHGEWRWPVAGLLFFMGTLLQLVGTFLE